MARLVLKGLNLSVSPVRRVRGHPPPRFHRDHTDHGALVAIGEGAIGADPTDGGRRALGQAQLVRQIRARQQATSCPDPAKAGYRYHLSANL